MLLAASFSSAYLPLGAGNVAVNLVIAALMIVLLATFLMDLANATALVRIVAVRGPVLDNLHVCAHLQRLSYSLLLTQLAMAKTLPKGDDKGLGGGSRNGRAPRDRSSDENQQITGREVEDIEERSSPRTPVIYEIVRRLGEEEMVRPIVSLWWSGLPPVCRSASHCWRRLFYKAASRTYPGGRWSPILAIRSVL